MVVSVSRLHGRALKGQFGYCLLSYICHTKIKQIVTLLFTDGNFLSQSDRDIGTLRILPGMVA